MHIRLKDGQVFAFAGLWLPGKRDGGVPSAAIVTTAPNELMATIHTRMPAILRPEDEAAWLDPQLTDAQRVMALVKPYPAECMEAYPVSPLVNSWENEGPELIAAVTPTVQLSF
jgi:putative SOS response-associated peptidase YedK